MLDKLQVRVYNPLMTTEQKRELVTIAEIARINKVTRQAVDQRMRKNRVPFQMFGNTRLVKRVDLHLLDFSR